MGFEKPTPESRSFSPTPEQSAVHEAWSREWVEQTDRLRDRIKDRVARIVREQEEDARIAEEVSKRLNQEIDAIIAEAQQEQPFDQAA